MSGAAYFHVAAELARARAHYAGPDDPALALERHEDQDRAKARGERVLAVCDAAIDALNVMGSLRTDRSSARVQMFHAVADALYGNQSIDIPELRQR